MRAALTLWGDRPAQGTITVEKSPLRSQRVNDLFAFASCGRAEERDTTKADLLFLPCKLADHFAATIKELQD